MKKLVLLFFSIIFVLSCKKDNQGSNIATNESSKTSASVSADDWVWAGNQNSNDIEIYDPASNPWSSSVRKFNWQPTAARGYSTYAVSKWVRPNDFKVRNISAWGGNHLCATGGGGLVTIASYPGGVKKWAYNVGFNPHGAELLPNGNIAVAATDDNTVRLFASSTGTDNITNASFPLSSPHSVLWDPTISRLWALGGDRIIALIIGGTAANPTLSEDTAKRGTLPTAWGHDMSVDLNNTGILWVSTNGGVYSFNKSTRAFTGAPGTVNKTFVKGISRQASGIFVITRPDSEKSPQPSNPVTSPTWCTRYVDFYTSAGSFSYLRNLSDSKFYRGKIFRTPY